MNSNKITNLTTPTAASDAANKSYVDTSIPIGGIIMWSGATGTTLPTNWKLCDGSTYNSIVTPDLRGRFVIGADGDATGGQGQAVAVTNIEGADTRKLIGGNKDAVVVAHGHTVSETSRGGKTVSGLLNHGVNGNFSSIATSGDETRPFNIQTADDHTHSVTVADAGVSGTNKNLPPYYALAFIMRVS